MIVNYTLFMNHSTQALLYSNTYANLATVSPDGQPWNTPVFFAYADGAVYWWSPIAAQHSQNIEHNHRVFMTIYNSTAPEGHGVGLYCRGVAHQLADSELTEAIAIYNSKAQQFQLTPTDCTGVAPTRLYTMPITEAWTNSEDSINGYYIDTRKKIAFKR